MRSPYDVNGSYTGTPQEGEKPVQDATISDLPRKGRRGSPAGCRAAFVRPPAPAAPPARAAATPRGRVFCILSRFLRFYQKKSKIALTRGANNGKIKEGGFV